MRRNFFSLFAVAVSILSLVPGFFFAGYWVRGHRYTDDIAWGSDATVFQMTGMTRFKSQGGGIWLEFSPTMVSEPQTQWEVFPATGQYCFAPSPHDKLTERMGFLLSAANGTWVFPCWFPALGCLAFSALCFVAAVRWSPWRSVRDTDDQSG